MGTQKGVLGVLAVFVVALVLALGLPGCDNPTGSNDDSGGGVGTINSIARDLRDYDPGDGALPGEPEPALMMSILPAQFAVMAIEQSESDWGDAFEEFGSFIDGWVEGVHSDAEWWEENKEWWEQSVDYQDDTAPDSDLIHFVYFYTDTGIIVEFEFEQELNVSETNISPEDGVIFTQGDIILSIGLDYSGVHEGEDEDSGSGRFIVFIEILNLRTEDGKNMIHEGFADLEVEFSGNLFYDTEEIGGHVSGSAVSGVSLNLEEGPEDLPPFNGKYVLQTSFDKDVESQAFQSAFDELFETIAATPLNVEVCNNPGEIIYQHLFTLEDFEQLGL